MTVDGFNMLFMFKDGGKGGVNSNGQQFLWFINHAMTVATGPMFFIRYRKKKQLIK